MDLCIGCDRPEDDHDPRCFMLNFKGANRPSALSAGVIKPCPFCGSDARVSKSVLTGQHAVLCKNEGCKGILEHFDSDEEAIMAWNKRAL